MSEKRPGEGDISEVSEAELAEQEKALGSLLRESLPAAPSDAPDLLPGVQRKIRRRSRGKFFADGWSTSQTRINYALVAFVMLIVIAVAYVGLAPTAVTR